MDKKHNILGVMAADIYQHKAYPSRKQLAEAANALVNKHTCMTERGSQTGCES